MMQRCVPSLPSRLEKGEDGGVWLGSISLDGQDPKGAVDVGGGVRAQV